LLPNLTAFIRYSLFSREGLVIMQQRLCKGVALLAIYTKSNP